MNSIRRAYIYLSAAVSLLAVSWAVVALLRGLVFAPPYRSIGDTAAQYAVVIIGLPLFFFHWLWGQRLAAASDEEQSAGLRALYLFGLMAAFLGPILANLFHLINIGLRSLFGVESAVRLAPGPSQGQIVLMAVVPILVFLPLLAYHRQVWRRDLGAVGSTEATELIRRLFVYGLSLVGLVLVTLGAGQLLSWLFTRTDSARIDATLPILAATITRLLIGLPLWLLFWQQAQTLYQQGGDGEQHSALRKFYLYLVVFASVMTTATSLTIIIAGFLRRVLELTSAGDMGDVLPPLIVAVIVWAYHGRVLRADGASAAEQPRQATIRRIYLYLVAGVGLAALLIGLGGNVSLLIRRLAAVDSAVLREPLAWFSAATLTGLVLWVWPWRQAQAAAAAPDRRGQLESQSTPRRIYLYLYLFVATMTVLGSGIFLVAQLISLLLGKQFDRSLLTDLAQALAYALIAVGVWVYHGRTLRADGRRQPAVVATDGPPLRVAVVDGGDGRLGQELLAALHRALPAASLQPFGLTPEARAAMAAEPGGADAPGLAEAQIIVGPWTIAVPGGDHGVVTPEIAAAVATSPARKLLIPKPANGWEWAGVVDSDPQRIVRHTVRAVKQIAAGEEVTADRSLSPVVIVAIVIGGLLLLGPILSLLFRLIFFAF